MSSSGPTAADRLRSVPDRVRTIAGVEGRLAGIEARLDAIEARLSSPELDGSALDAVRDAVRDLSVQVTEELDQLAETSETTHTTVFPRPRDPDQG